MTFCDRQETAIPPTGRDKSFSGLYLRVEIKEWTMMKQFLAGFILLAVCGMVLNAQDVAPNEVKVFEHVNYIGSSASYKIEDGMRHKLVSFLGDLDMKISSMLIGSEVVVMPFTETNFNNGYRMLGLIHDGSGLDLRKLPDKYNDSIRSLVVFRKSDFEVHGTYKDPWGAYMRSSFGNYMNGFIPLPEQQKDIEVRLGYLSQWNKTPYVTVSIYDQLEITLFDQLKFQGNPLYLPGAAPDKLARDSDLPNFLIFPLEEYEFEGKQSSLILRIRGAVPAPPEREGGGTGTTHRAPPAGGGDAPKPVQMKLGTINLEPISIAGTWKSNIGLVYDITQNKDKFTWKVRDQSQVGEGTITGDAVNVTWIDLKGRGGAKGKIILDRGGKAVRIEWTNGVIFRQ